MSNGRGGAAKDWFGVVDRQGGTENKLSSTKIKRDDRLPTGTFRRRYERGKREEK